MNKKQLFALVLLTTVFQSVFAGQTQNKFLLESVNAKRDKNAEKALSQGADINTRNKLGQTPLMIAVQLNATKW